MGKHHLGDWYGILGSVVGSGTNYPARRSTWLSLWGYLTIKLWSRHRSDLTYQKGFLLAGLAKRKLGGVVTALVAFCSVPFLAAACASFCALAVFSLEPFSELTGGSVELNFLC